MYVYNYRYEAEWTPLQTHYLTENLVASGIEPGTSELAARNSDHVTTEAVHFRTYVDINYFYYVNIRSLILKSYSLVLKQPPYRAFGHP
jgi:hypothetical protein